MLATSQGSLLVSHWLGHFIDHHIGHGRCGAQQEILLQQKEQHIVEQERRLRRLEEHQEQQQQPVRQTISTSTSVKKPSTSRGGTIDNFISEGLEVYAEMCEKRTN